MRARSKKILAVLGALGLTLLPVEIYFRVFAPKEVFYHQGTNLYYSSDFGFRQRPDTTVPNVDEFGKYSYAMNEFGFRGPPFRGPPTEGERILFVGDSFLNGHTVRTEHWMPEATRKLLLESGRSVEVHSLAVSDFGTAQELMLLREYGEDIQPKAVVLVMFPYNDVANNGLRLAGLTSQSAGDYLRPYLTPDANGELERTYLHPWRARLRSVSTAFRHLERNTLVWAKQEGHAWPSLYPHLEEINGRDRLRSDRACAEFEEVFRIPKPDGAWADAWQTTEALLSHFDEEVRSLGARLLVIVIPAWIQAQRFGPAIELAHRYRDYGQEIEGFLDWNLPERRLHQFFERQGIEARYILSPLRRAAREEDRMYARDAHLNWRGHAIIAEEVSAWFAGRPSPHGSEEPPQGSPTPLVNRLSWLDFREEAHEAYLANGFHTHRSSVNGSPRGWMTSSFATVVVRSRPEDLVLRGTVPKAMGLPVKVRLGLARGFTREFTISKSGPFELIISRSQITVPSEGFVSIQLKANRTYRKKNGTATYGILVNEIGFRDLPPPAEPGAALLLYLDQNLDGLLQLGEAGGAARLFGELDRDGDQVLTEEELSFLPSLISPGGVKGTTPAAASPKTAPSH